LLTRSLLSSPPRVGRLHGDPHPGNFRLLDDGRLAVMDFGSTLPMPYGWPPRLSALMRAGRDHDAAAAFELATATALLDPDVTTPEAFLDLLDPLLEPLRHEEFTFSRRWLRSQTVRFSDPRSSVARTQRRLRMPVRHLLVQRVAAGAAGVLCLLGAPVPVAQEAATWLPGLDEDM
jgi:predicted unusual protein kinase regulating ubiquinone biosynthesis (AarF/ABC1/UbiB family)